MTVKEYLKVTRALRPSGLQALRRHVVCNDGFIISVQASSGHYCTPQEDMLEEYQTVELGLPNRKDDLILPYAEDPEWPTTTVYPQVPMDLVELLIEKHGGLMV